MKKTVANRDIRLITDKATEDYLDSLCPGNCAVLENIRARAELEDIPIIRRGSEELLKTVMMMRKPENILEIGTAVGYSALVMAQTLPRSSIVTLEIGDIDYEKALANFALYARSRGLEYKTDPEYKADPGREAGSAGAHSLKIHALHINADDYLPRAVSEGKKFDMIFLDAAKAQYMVWLADILKLLTDGGVLVADNVLLDGTIAMSRYALDRRDRTAHKRMREFLYAITHDPKLTTSVVPSGDGVSISIYHEQGSMK